MCFVKDAYRYTAESLGIKPRQAQDYPALVWFNWQTPRGKRMYDHDEPFIIITSKYY